MTNDDVEKTGRWISFGAVVLVSTGLISCGQEQGAEQTTAPKSATHETAKRAEQVLSETSGPKRKFQPVDLGDGRNPPAAKPVEKVKVAAEQQSQSIIAALQPFQVLLGQWRWIAKKNFGNSVQTGEDLEWIWDFQTDPNRPALKAATAGNPYFRALWLTWLPDEDKFQLTAKTAEGDGRVLRGTWIDKGEPKEESDGRKVQHTYKLQLSQVTPESGDQWLIVLNQLDNNQYLIDLSRRPAAGKQPALLANMRQQRQGTSFAVADSDNPGPKCIISGGLGTMNVEYQGKSYPVCCSGCAAAFKDDPERWLARLAAKTKSKKRDE
jgi:hypothetical protein